MRHEVKGKLETQERETVVQGGFVFDDQIRIKEDNIDNVDITILQPDGKASILEIKSQKLTIGTNRICECNQGWMHIANSPPAFSEHSSHRDN